MYYIYILRMENNSLYTGIAADLSRRLRQHVTGQKAAAKYTKSHRVQDLAALWSGADRGSASRLEAAIKGLTKAKKEALIAEPRLFSTFFPWLEEEDFVHHPLASLPLFLGQITLKHLL